MQKTEKVVLGLLTLLYLNKITGFIELEFLYIFLNLIVFIIIAVNGYEFYRYPKKANKLNVFFSILCGLAFSLGLFSFTMKIWYFSNYLLVVFGSLNTLLFLILIYLIANSDTDLFKYYKGLLIRSSFILITIVVLFLTPKYLVNIYLNRDVEVYYNQGLSDKYYFESIDCIEKGDFSNGIKNAEKSLSLSKKIYGNNLNEYKTVYESLYSAYVQEINFNYSKGNFEGVLNASIKIEKPIKIWFGNNSKEESEIKNIQAEIYSQKGLYKISDSLFFESLKMLKKHFNFKNYDYLKTLFLLADSYESQMYLNDAVQLYKSVISISENNLLNYKSNNNLDLIVNYKDLISASNARIANILSIKNEIEKSNLYFQNAFKNKSFKNSKQYFKAITDYASHQIKLENFKKAKYILEKTLNLVIKKSGKINYDYLYVLDGINSLNVSLANYKKAEEGCVEAIDILKQITNEKTNFYGSLLNRLANVENYLGNYNDAEKKYKEALKYSDVNSLQYSEILKSLSNLKATFSEYNESLKLAIQARIQAEEYFKNEFDSELKSFYQNEAYSNYLNGELIKSQFLYSKCFSFDTLKIMKNDLSNSITFNGLGLISYSQNNFNVSNTYYTKSLEIIKNKLGVNHPDYALVQYNLAYLKLKEGRKVEAENLFKQSLNKYSKVFDLNHDKIGDVFVGLAEINLSNKNYKESIKLFKKALKIYNLKFKVGNLKSIELNKKLVFLKSKL